MKKIKNVIVLILILSFLFTILTACGEETSQENEKTAGAESGANPEAPASGEQEQEQEAENLSHGLDGFDFKGREFKILNTVQSDLMWVNMMMEPPSGESTGEIINDAAWQRSTEIQEKYNAKITEIHVSHSQRDSTFRNSALAGDNAYDIGMLFADSAIQMAQQGLAYALNEFEHINLDAPWWDRNARKSLSVRNNVYFLPGAYEISNIDMTRTVLFNKQMMQDYGIPYNPYQLVLDGKWTMDQFFSMSKITTGDVNGDGKYDHQDMYGINSGGDHVTFGAFIMGAGETMGGKDADDMPYFKAGSERFLNIYGYLTDNFHEGDIYFQHKWMANAAAVTDAMFSENRSLFYITNFNRVPRFRAMDSDFGILPIPKYDEAQANYHNESGGGLYAIVPSSSSEVQNIGAFLELYAYYGSQYVVPAYKEMSLQTKFTRSAESAQMVDIIYDNRIYDIVRIFWPANAFDPIVTLFGNAGAEIASLIEKNTPLVEADIQNTIDAFQK